MLTPNANRTALPRLIDYNVSDASCDAIGWESGEIPDFFAWLSEQALDKRLDVEGVDVAVAVQVATAERVAAIATAWIGSLEE